MMKTRWWLCLTLIVTFSVGIPAVVQETTPAELLKTAEDMVQTAARLRGLEPKSRITKGIKSRDEISQFLNQRVKEEYSDGEIREEEKFLRKLGLIPASMDYREFVLKLLTEQVGGFYDPKQESLFIASWLPPEEQKPVLIHELVHALQDQHFDVQKIIENDRKANNDDRALAHQAFLEGDAVAVMLNYLLEPAKRTFDQVPELDKKLRMMQVSAQTQYPVFKSAPQYLQETLIFPYGYGAFFLQQVWLHNPSWTAVNRIYSDLPDSTEQVLHPEKYLVERDRPKPVDPESTVSALGGNWKTTYRNVLGEFSLGLLLNQHLSGERSRRSAAGWGGDQVLLLEDEAGRNAVVVCTVWDNLAEAQEFFSDMQEWLQKRFPAGKPQSTQTEFSITEKGETHALRQEGTAVQLVIGFPQEVSPFRTRAR